VCAPHPLREVWTAAADGRFPPVDGAATFVPPLPGGLEMVVSFTGHVYLATALPRSAWDGVPLDGFGAALDPSVLQKLAGVAGEVGVLDVTLFAHGRGGSGLPPRPDLADHPRVLHARGLRTDIRVHGDERGLVTVAAGHAGRTEISVEVFDAGGRGSGRALVAEALRLAPDGEPVFAAVSPGNARSLRAFLAVGFTPIGSEVWIRPAGR
jgi:hypothetical protein